jgi:tetratricopeptide (TPR) repeat protein
VSAFRFICWLLLGILVTVGSAAARPADPALLKVSRLLFENRIEQADAALKPIESTRAADPSVLLLRGEILFQLGSYDESVKVLRKAMADSRLPAAEQNEGRAMLDLAVATAEATRGLVEQTSPSGHFVFRYRRGKDEVLIPHASAALDKAWAALAQDFADSNDPQAAAPIAPVRVEIYEEIADLARVSTLTLREIETSGTIALCKWNRLMIVSPKALLRGYPWLDTLTHEYTHYIVSRAGRGQVPLWIHEGLAKFEEKRWRGPSGGGLSPAMEQLLSTAQQKKRLITFEQMSPSMAKLPSQEDTALAFAEVYTFIEYLHGRAGFGGIRTLISALSEGVGESKAMHSAFGVPFDELDHGWRSFLRGRKVRARLGPYAEKLRFRKQPSSKASPTEEDESGDISDPKVRGFVRLGGLLRARGRLHAAAFEYEKAASQAAAPHPLVGLKLGRTYLDLNDAERAITALEPASEQYPEWAGLQAALGTAYLRKGDLTKAEAALEGAISTSPYDPNVHCGLKTIYEQRKSPQLEQASRACGLLGGR